MSSLGSMAGANQRVLMTWAEVGAEALKESDIQDGLKRREEVAQGLSPRKDCV